jgi:hypothetical protein
MPANPYVVSRAVSAAAKVRLAACAGMNPQDFVLLAHDLFEAFTGRHVKWLRYGLGFMLRQSLEGRGTKSVNPGGLSGLLRDADLWSSVEQQSAGFGVPSAHIAPFL